MRPMHDALMGVPKMQPRLFRPHCSRLEKKDACDDLQAICDTVLHFLQQYFLLLQQAVQLALRGAPIGDVLDGK